MTRFTEEGFSSLISFIFISDAIKKMVGAFKYYPIDTKFKPDYITTYKCECLAPDPSEFTPELREIQKGPKGASVAIVWLSKLQPANYIIITQ